jgi:trans-2,3-dihydro-3-hydroxyanthranilate isomerase
VPHRFHIVDVFAEARWAGNTLAVVRDAADLDAGAMQAIAREFGFSETTFVVSDPAAPGDGVRVRVFTPAEELPFAGHPTLGTAWVIREHLARERAGEVALALGVGRVVVRFEPEQGGGELAWLAAPPVELGRRLAAERLAPALGLAVSDFDAALPVQHVLAGVSFVFAPLRGLDALRRARLDLDAFAPLASEGFPPNVYFFCRETLEPANDLHVRLLFAAPGVREDPATGSAAACLGAYLLGHRALGSSDLALRLEQGHGVSRPSLLRLRARERAGERSIAVGGRVIESARGELL